MDLSAPTILQPRVRIKSQHLRFALFNLDFEFKSEKDENKQKRPGLVHIWKNYFPLWWDQVRIIKRDWMTENAKDFFFTRLNFKDKWNNILK